MDFAAHNAVGAINGVDILLWVGLLYLAPRLLKLRLVRPFERPVRVKTAARVKAVTLRVA